jgi:uncharacterized paraquat-inducible protein A
MMKFMRRYGYTMFLVPIAVFWIDDYATAWHDHGRESIQLIVLENMAEDAVVFVAALMYQWWRARTLANIHCQCPKCQFTWTMHPKQSMPYCPRCGAAEPT